MIFVMLAAERRAEMGMARAIGTKRRHLNDLEREVLANPTPQNMVSLIERYMAAADEAKALEMARKGVEKFQNSEKVQTTYQNVRSPQPQAPFATIICLAKEIGSGPTVWIAKPRAKSRFGSVS